MNHDPGDPRYYLPPLREGESYYLVLPGANTGFDQFVTISTSEGRLRELLFEAGYPGSLLLRKVEEAEAFSYTTQWRHFEYVALLGSAGMYYVLLPGHEPMFLDGYYKRLELLAHKLECKGIWGGELRNEHAIVFWFPYDRYNDYLAVCHTEGENHGRDSADLTA